MPLRYFWCELLGTGGCWCLFNWLCVCPSRWANVTPRNERLGVLIFFFRKLYCILKWRDGHIGFLSCACNFRGPTSTRGDSGLLESCRQSDLPSDFTVILIPGTKPFASLFFPSYSSVGKESTCNAGRPQSNSWVRKIHWRRDRLPAPVFLGFPCGSVGKESACNTGDLGLIPGLGRSPGEGKDCPLQYSGLENSMDYIVHGVAKSQTWLSNFHFSLLKVHGLFSTTSRYHTQWETQRELSTIPSILTTQGDFHPAVPWLLEGYFCGSQQVLHGSKEHCRSVTGCQCPVSHNWYSAWNPAEFWPKQVPDIQGRPSVGLDSIKQGSWTLQCMSEEKMHRESGII